METKTNEKLNEAELVDQQVAPSAAQPAAPEDVAQAQQQVQAPIEPAGTNGAVDELSTPTEPQAPINGMNDDGTFTPPAPGMVPTGWANPADLAAAVAMATGDAEAAATAPDAQVTEEPVVSPEGQAAMAGQPQDPNALTAEDQGMVESLTHADFELLREYKRYKEEKSATEAVAEQNKIQDSAAKALSALGTVTTAFKDADLHVKEGLKCIEISSKEPLAKSDVETRLNSRGFALVSFLPGVDPEDPEKFLTKVVASKNDHEIGKFEWQDDAVKHPDKDLEANKLFGGTLKGKDPIKESAEESDQAPIQESAEGQDQISGEAGKEVAKETEELQDEVVQPAVAMNGIQEKKAEKKESLTESLKKLFREAEAIPESPDDIPSASEAANEEADLLGSDEADVSGLFQDEDVIPEEDEVDASSLEADLAAIFDEPVDDIGPDPEPMPEIGPEPMPEEGEDVVAKAADVLRVAADHLEDIAADEKAEDDVEISEDDSDLDIAEDTSDSPEIYDFEDEDKDSEVEINEKVERIPVKLPERPFAKQELPKRPQLKVREKIQYPVGSRPEENLVEAYQNVVDARHAAVLKFREALQASKKPANPRFTEALRNSVTKSADSDENPRSWASNRFEEKAQRLEALDYKKLLREGFLG